MASKIYTKSGDKGMTSLFGGTKVSKDDIKVEAYGVVDELNAQLGMLVDMLETDTHKKILLEIQNELFSIGSFLASDPSMADYLAPLSKELIVEIERSIDRMQDEMPQLKNFIIPGGSRAVSQCHIVRTVCRRAERRIVSVSDETLMKEVIVQFMNRLSDYFFVLARNLAWEKGIEERIWKQNK